MFPSTESVSVEIIPSTESVSVEIIPSTESVSVEIIPSTESVSVEIMASTRGRMLGLLIGYYQSTAAVAVSATLQGLAAGTFIHVTFMEVIPAEFNLPGPRLLKVCVLGTGYIFLLFCTVLISDPIPH
ncbi:uncharacterized protein CDAR_594391 [Caerostris darwini]|uniref:Uncharacterized protein n=1 Tax=Caerostris darwini TaxID=1538125 RepID=A0AAV4VQ68_9ARAC|nr:uncharacterized protein CDAR_594391 [Caerostris darwini]